MNVAGKLEKMGVRTSPMAEENLLGKEDMALFLFTQSMAGERGCSLGSAVGSM